MRDQLAVLHRLIQDHADAFIQNLRPGTSGKYGLDAESLRAKKPELICADVGAYGHVGPLNREPGYDPLMQAFGGIMSVTGEEGQAPVRAGVSIVDIGTGMWAAIGVLAALQRRDTKRVGAHVNSSLLETAIAWMSVGVANYRRQWRAGGRHGSGVAFIVPHRAYGTADGHLIVSCANDRLFARLCDALGRPEWAVDERFGTNSARLRNRCEIDALIGEVLSKHPRAHWQDLLQARGLPSAPIQTTEEMVRHEQTRALGIIASPSDDEIELVGLPLSLDGERPPPLAGAQRIGEANPRLLDLLSAKPTL